MKNGKPGGELFLLLATLCWSMSGVLTKSLSISPVLSNALRSLIAIFILLAYNRWKVRMNKTIWLGAVCGLLMSTLFFIALDLTPAANAVVMQYTAPIFVLLFTCLRERRLPGKMQVFVVLAAFAGVAVVFSSGFGGGSLVGNLAALVSGVAFAGMFFVNRLPGAEPADAMILAFALSAVTGVFYLGQLPGMSAREWGVVLLMGVVQHGLAYVFFSIGIRTCPSFSSSLIGMLETVLVPLWVFLVFGEAPSAKAVLGSGLIIAAVVTNTLYEHKKAAALCERPPVSNA